MFKKEKEKTCPQIVARYTENTWDKYSFVNDKFNTSQMPDSVNLFIENALWMLNKKDRKKITDIFIVTIDEEYEIYLKEKQLEHSAESMRAYMSDMSIENADRLLQKNKMDYSYIPVFCPLPVLIPQSGECSFSKETINHITDYIKKAVPDCDVYVHENPIRSDVYLNDMQNINTSQLINLAKAYIEDGQKANYGKFKEIQFLEDSILGLLGIVIVLRYKHPSAFINLESENHMIYNRLNQIDFENQYQLNSIYDFMDNVVPIQETGIYEEIEKDCCHLGECLLPKFILLYEDDILPFSKHLGFFLAKEAIKLLKKEKQESTKVKILGASGLGKARRFITPNILKEINKDEPLEYKSFETQNEEKD